MPSKTSFFNFTVFKKTVLQNYPFWVLFWIALILGLPLNAFKTADAVVFCRNSLTVIMILSVPAAMGAALVSFNYLSKTRSCYMMHSFPVTKLSLYASNGLAGLAMLLVPFLTSFTFSLSSALSFSTLFMLCLLSLAVILFFYALAVLSMIVTGNSTAAVFLYAFLNIGAVVLEFLIRVLLEPLMYGFYAKKYISYPFSPIFRLIETLDELPNYLPLQHYCAFLAVLAAVFLFLGYFLYRLRHAEAAGEIVAHTASRPIFKYLVTVFASLALGEFFCLIIFQDVDSYRNTLSVSALLIFGAFLGFFGAEMLLRKSLRVFTGKNILAFLIYSFLLLGTLAIFYFDLPGFVAKVPASEDICSVEFQLPNEIIPVRIEDPEDFESVRDIHEELISERDYDSSTLRYAVSNFVIVYHLQSGKELCRHYPVYMDSETQAEISALCSDPEITQAWISDVFESCGEMRLECYVPAGVSDSEVYELPGMYEIGSGDYWINYEIADSQKDLLKEALLADAAEGKFEIFRQEYPDDLIEISLYYEENGNIKYVGLLPIPAECERASAFMKGILA